MTNDERDNLLVRLEAQLELEDVLGEDDDE